MKNKYLTTFALITSFILLFGQCTKDKANQYCEYSDCAPGSVSYKSDIEPMIEQHCVNNQGPGTGCHDGWIFNFSSLEYRIDNGMVAHEVIDTRDMPPIPNNFNIKPLTDEQIRLWRCWICDGFPEN